MKKIIIIFVMLLALTGCKEKKIELSLIGSGVTSIKTNNDVIKSTYYNEIVELINQIKLTKEELEMGINTEKLIITEDERTIEVNFYPSNKLGIKINRDIYYSDDTEHVKALYDRVMALTKYSVKKPYEVKMNSSSFDEEKVLNSGKGNIYVKFDDNIKDVYVTEIEEGPEDEFEDFKFDAVKNKVYKIVYNKNGNGLSIVVRYNDYSFSTSIDRNGNMVDNYSYWGN